LGKAVREVDDLDAGRLLGRQPLLAFADLEPEDFGEQVTPTARSAADAA
jgi:hypothetical protein